MNKADELRSLILYQMKPILDNTQIIKLENTLDFLFGDYDITQKSRELAIMDDHNDVLLKNFLATKTISGMSQKTIYQYMAVINLMLGDIGKNIEDITTDDIRKHLAKWQIQKSALPSTINHMRSVYSSFFGWLEIESYILVNPMKRISPIKFVGKPVEPFTEVEVEKMLNSCESLRDNAIVRFLLSTGVRAEECVDLNISDIDFHKAEFIVREGKGGKPRKLYISDVTMMWLTQYLETRKDNDDALWISRYGRLTVRGLQTIVSRIAEKAGVEKAHPHKFRHTFATDMAKKGVPVEIIQALLGHTNINTTMIYVKMNEEQIRSYFNRLVA